MSFGKIALIRWDADRQERPDPSDDISHSQISSFKDSGSCLSSQGDV